MRLWPLKRVSDALDSSDRQSPVRFVTDVPEAPETPTTPSAARMELIASLSQSLLNQYPDGTYRFEFAINLTSDLDTEDTILWQLTRIAQEFDVTFRILYFNTEARTVHIRVHGTIGPFTSFIASYYGL